MFHVAWIDFVIVILASFRLTRLIVFDEITAFIRNPFLSVTVKEGVSGQMEQVIELKGKGLRYFIGSLLSCYWCAGFWCSLGVVIVYFCFPFTFTFPFFLVFAVAGAAAVIESKI